MAEAVRGPGVKHQRAHWLGLSFPSSDLRSNWQVPSIASSSYGLLPPRAPPCYPASPHTPDRALAGQSDAGSARAQWNSAAPKIYTDPRFPCSLRNLTHNCHSLFVFSTAAPAKNQCFDIKRPRRTGGQHPRSQAMASPPRRQPQRGRTDGMQPPAIAPKHQDPSCDQRPHHYHRYQHRSGSQHWPATRVQQAKGTNVNRRSCRRQ